MKIAILSDIHSNLEALMTVLKDLQQQKVDKILCLGDIIGYGPYPQECLDLIKKYAEVIVRGNHEDTTCWPDKYEERLSMYALEGIRFSRKSLSDENIDFLSKLSTVKIMEDLSITLAHGSFTEDSSWQYINNESEAKKELASITTKLCFIGHTHIPFVFGSNKGLYKILPDNLILEKNQKFLINVGSVGQPRDGDCRACYGILSVQQETVFNLRRVFYDVETTAKAIRKAKLPFFLGERLFRGE